jgi:hypothetical protein
MSTALAREGGGRATAWLVWALAGGSGIVAWMVLAANAHTLHGDPMCVLRRVAHLACPTCGMTRALALLAAGEWRAALALHPWAPMIAAQIVAGWWLWGLTLARGHGRTGRWGRRIAQLEGRLPHVVALNAAALIVIWIARIATGTLPPI